MKTCQNLESTTRRGFKGIVQIGARTFFSCQKKSPFANFMDRKSDFWIGNLIRNMILVNLYIFLQNDSIPYNRRVSASKTCVFADLIDFLCFYHHFWIGKLRDNLQSPNFIIISISDPKIMCIGQHKYSW